MNCKYVSSIQEKKVWVLIFSIFSAFLCLSDHFPTSINSYFPWSVTAETWSPPCAMQQSLTVYVYNCQCKEKKYEKFTSLPIILCARPPVCMFVQGVLMHTNKGCIFRFGIICLRVEILLWVVFNMFVRFTLHTHHQYVVTPTL